MNISTIIPISQARSRIFEIAKDVNRASNHYILTENGKPKAVIMSAVEFESWVETLEVLNEFPNLTEDIQAAKQDLATGDYITLDELLADEGYIKADKKGSKSKHVVSSRYRKKSSKRNQKNR